PAQGMRLSFADGWHSYTMKDGMRGRRPLCATFRVADRYAAAVDARALLDGDRARPARIHPAARSTRPASVSAGMTGSCIRGLPPMRGGSSHVRSSGGVLGITR